MKKLVREMKRRFSDEELPSYIYTYPTKRAYKPFTDWELAAESWKDVTGSLALYIHIPFCQMKCSFCDLFTVTNQAQVVVERYVQALTKEIQLMKPYLQQDLLRVHSIYFGGGTPTLLNKHQLIQLLTHIRETFVIAPSAEISIEGAPNSFSEDMCATLYSLGFTRVSIGIQSFNRKELAAMGRLYDVSSGHNVALQAINSGIKNVNLDLIYGIPGQTRASWEKTLHTALELRPKTITCYPLAVRKPTTYGIKIARGLIAEPLEAKELYRWYDENLKIFSQHGYEQHTFVTYAKDGGGCTHEANEFVGMPTLSFGAGARKYAPNLHYVDEDYSARISNRLTMLNYMEAVEQNRLLVRTAAHISRQDQLIRHCILGLLSSGINKDYFTYFPTLFDALQDEEYLQIGEEKIVLTAKGKRKSAHIGQFIADQACYWYEQEPFQAFWERGYRSHEVSCMGGPSFEVAEILPALPPKAKVLDLGCGEGRNAFFLAQHGCDVTAIDRSEAAIQKLQILSKKHNISLKAIAGNIVDYPFTEMYDLVLGHGVLYYLENSVWKALLEKVKRHTNEGGFNIFTIFVYNERFPCTPEIQAASYKNSFIPNELQEFYRDWHIQRFDQYTKWDTHPDIGEHCHPIEKLVAQKSVSTFSKMALDIGNDLLHSDFMQCEIGLSENALLRLLGPPHAIEKTLMKGPQFGNSGDATTALDFCLELWYYGKYAFYLGNAKVSGKAHYITHPVKLVRNIHLIMGPPGSGKSTLIQKMHRDGYYTISMGNLLREKARICPSTKALIDSGKLLGNHEAVLLFENALEKALRNTRPIAIEGFPSTMSQYSYFLQCVKKHNVKIDVHFLECSDEVAVERMLARLVCSACYAPHTQDKTLCDHCKQPLYKRKEDTLLTAHHRLKQYNETTLPITRLCKSDESFKR